MSGENFLWGAKDKSEELTKFSRQSGECEPDSRHFWRVRGKSPSDQTRPLEAVTSDVVLIKGSPSIKVIIKPPAPQKICGTGGSLGRLVVELKTELIANSFVSGELLKPDLPGRIRAAVLLRAQEPVEVARESLRPEIE